MYQNTNTKILVIHGDEIEHMTEEKLMPCHQHDDIKVLKNQTQSVQMQQVHMEHLI